MNEISKWIKIVGIFIFLSFITGAAAAGTAVTIDGIVYDILYGVHKILSVLAIVIFVVFFLKGSKD